MPLLSLTAARKAPSWHSWVRLGSSLLNAATLELWLHQRTSVFCIYGSFIPLSLRIPPSFGFMKSCPIPVATIFLNPANPTSYHMSSSPPAPPLTSKPATMLRCLTSCSKNKQLQSSVAMTSRQRRRGLAGIMTKATPRDTPNPAGMTQRRLRVRRAGTTLEPTPSPTGTTMAPKWNRVAGVMMERTR